MSARSRPAGNAPTPLRAALDEVVHAPPGTLAAHLCKLQGDLLNAVSSRLLLVEGTEVRALEGNTQPTAGEAALARDAARDGAIHMQGGAGDVAFAAPLGRAGNGVVIALHRLAQATPLTIAFAQERLELSGALSRLLVAGGKSDPGAEFAGQLIRAAAANPSETAKLLATALQSRLGAGRVAAGLVRGLKIVSPWDTAAGDKLPPSAEAQIALALGEVVDMPVAVRGPGSGLPGFEALTAGETCIGLARLSGGDGLVAILWGSVEEAELAGALSLAGAVAIARQSRPRLSDRFDTLAQRLPWPAAIQPERRPRLARQLAAGLVAAFLLLPFPAAVSAPLSIEPQVKRIVTAPLSARIDRVEVEPGDRVTAGQLLLLLDTHALERERDEASAQLQAAAVEQGRARDEGDSDAARLAELRMAQVQANLSALEGRIAEGEVRASMAGTVGGSDLKQRLGATVSRGEQLFTVSAGTGMRAELMVSDRDIGRVRLGDTVSLALSARPFSRESARVSRIYPVAEVTRTGNVFRVIASLDAEADTLRPGMEGTGRIRTGWRPLAWQLLEPAVRWLRLKIWL
ncbi:efflux RND transporter periplasmic adaptor subunit [Sandaracinobacteroides hominis]|uniref:efflux RND transporter periplasmic adaptor subunit n=1 Tax=Sandaracinobacteroides hominis TaxID=2780086 RepID=UPI0018F4BB6D|nr:efflux RND transporter periplasmic adaptor subunit [Sandaracinobacteroides hominis]